MKLMMVAPNKCLTVNLNLFPKKFADLHVGLLWARSYFTVFRHLKTPLSTVEFKSIKAGMGNLFPIEPFHITE